MATLELSLVGVDDAIAVERYLTDEFAAISLHAANRLAQIFNISFNRVQITKDVKLLHRGDFWAWWSDDKLTTSVGLPKGYEPKNLSPCAEKLIHKVCLSATSRPICGWAKLAGVKQIVSTERIAIGSRKETLDRLVIEYADGQQEVLYALFSAENTETYFYQVSTQIPVETLKNSSISRINVSIDELQLRIEKYDSLQPIAA